MDAPDIIHDGSFSSRLASMLKPDSLIPALVAGGSNAVLIISIELSFAAMLFSQDLSSFMSKGIGILLFGTFIVAMVTAVKSSLPSCSSLVSIHKWPFSAISAPNCGVSCAAYYRTPPRNPLFSSLASLGSVPLLRSGFPEALTLREIAHL